MSNFSDREDRHLVQLTSKYEQRQERISWKHVASEMKYSKQDPRTLRQRLTSLKATHGKSLARFPAWFSVPTKAKAMRRGASAIVDPAASRRTDAVTVVATRFPQGIDHPPMPQGVDAVSDLVFDTTLFQLFDLACSARLDDESQWRGESVHGTAITPGVCAERAGCSKTPLSETNATAALACIFGHVERAQVRQTAGRTDHNVGEVTVATVTQIITRCALSPRDIFLDIGAGVGNVVVQVALQSSVGGTIGVEVREDVATLGIDLVQKALPSFPRLGVTQMIRGDIVNLEEMWTKLAPATVLFSNNLLFHPAAELATHQLCCQLPYLRLVLVMSKVCPRHKLRRAQTFCAVWKLQDTMVVFTEFRSSPVQLFVYEKHAT